MRAVGVAVLSVLLFSCGENDVKTVRVAKAEHPPEVAMQQAPAQRPQPQVQAPAEPSGGFSVTLPEGWTEVPGTGMRKVSYAIEGSSVDFYLLILGMGDVPSNVNRWRGQIGLAPASIEDIVESVERLTVDGRAVSYETLYNPESGKGIIAAIVDLAPAYWYFTAKGSVEELQAQEATIRAFLTSMRF